MFRNNNIDRKMKRTFICFILGLPLHVIAQSNGQNYVMTETMLDADGSSKVSSVQYCDGLGQPNILATNGLNTMGMTAYTLLEYDFPDLVVNSWLPGVDGSSLEWKSPNSIKELSISTNQDESPYSITERDVLGRVTSVCGPGEEWHTLHKDVSTMRYTNVVGGNSDYIVKRYIVSAGDALIENGVWDDSTLGVEIISDEDDKTILVFTDFYGQKILERRLTGNGLYNDTYFVYNDYGQLRFVLTPAFEKISPSKAMFAYEYRYDDRGRVEWKKLPGTEHIQYWYDVADRVMATQDATMRNNSKYRFFIYDNFGRVAIQGLCSQYTHNDSLLAKATYGNGPSGFLGTGYAVPPALVGSFTDPELEIVNYYDNYDFTSNHQISAMPELNIDAIQEENATGFLTGQVAYATNGEALGTVNVYDGKGQVVRSVRKGLGGLLEDVGTAYSFTGAVDTVRVNVNVGYGSGLTAETVYTYSKGKKTKMRVSVSHGRPAVSRETDYAYDAVGRLGGKSRHLNGTGVSSCSYSYDVHGWPTSVVNGGFEERLYYADGLGVGSWNGNISTVKWRSGSGSFEGYNLEYDGCDRLNGAVYGYGDNLTGYRNYFDEHVEYDCNGNITRLRRGGLTDNLHGGFGLVDDLYMTYEGNMLVGVRDCASRYSYAGATDFDGVTGQEYPLTYNGAGSLVSDAGRGIARIDYDLGNNPVRIQFTDGNVTKYIYSSTGEKLRVVYQTAVPNVSVAIGSARELSPSEILSADSVDYLLGGCLTLRNGRIDRFLFEEGYCQAKRYRYNHSQDDFIFYYYDRDHLGNIRQVVKGSVSDQGNVVQSMDYYPFGAQFCDGSTDNNFQSRRYNGKEFDNMHGLNTYDYGARQYNPVIARWDRVDPLCEKYYGISPYGYCGDNPVNIIDPVGLDYWSTNDPDKICEFWKNVNSNDINNINYTGWDHSTGADFLANLYYNDKTNKYYYSYGTVENDEVVCYSQSFSGKMVDMDWLTDLGVGNTSFEMAMGAAEYKLGNKLKEANKYTFYNLNGSRYNPTAPKVIFRNIAQEFDVASVAKFANGMKLLGATTCGISVFMTGMEIYQGKKNIVGEGGLDLIMTGAGFIPGYGWIISGTYFLVKYGMEKNQWDFWNNR